MRRNSLFLSLTQALRTPRENEHAGPHLQKSPTCLDIHVCAHTPLESKAPESASLPREREANIPDSICCSLRWRDNALAKHYNQQAREVTASPRITTAEKCLSLTISVSATLTYLPFPSPTLPSATFFPGLHPRLHDLHECAAKYYSHSVRKCWTKTKESKKNPIK